MAGDIVPPEGRVCKMCGVWKPLSQYSLTKRDGYLARCKRCCLDAGKRWRTTYPEKVKAARRRAFIRWREKNPRLPPREPLVTKEGRLCSNCSQRWPEENFTTDRRNADGLSRRCKACAKKMHAEWRAENIEHVREKSRRERVDWYSTLSVEERRQRLLKRKYGISAEQFASMLDAQSGKCAICDKYMTMGNQKADAACVDHDHETGRIRGVLCSRCNSAIGLLADDAALLRAAADYLVRSHDDTC